MNKILLYGFTIAVFGLISENRIIAQTGISFEHGTWSEVKAKAKATNLPIFIDMYTSWCMPCKKMVKEVFTLQEVGDKFNKGFINYKIDAEKGEGIAIAKKFKVSSYPTYLFLTGDETLVYRSVGAMPAEKFLSEASVAIAEFNSPKPLAAWEDEYETRKTDSAFLFAYIGKRKKLRLNCADLLDQYFKVVGKDAILKTDLLVDLGIFQNLNTDGPFYTYLFQNKDEIRKVIFEKFKRGVLVNEYLVYTAKNDVERAAAANDEKLLEHIVTILLQLPADDWPIEWRVGESKMKFYTQTKNPQELIKVLEIYSNQVVGLESNKVAEIDSAAVRKFDSDLAAGKLKTIKPEDVAFSRKSRSTVNSTTYAYRIRDLSKSVLNTIDDKVWLNKSLQWLNKASTFSDNFTIDEVRAGIIYKIGKKDDALKMQQKSIDNFIEMMKQMNLTNEKIQKRLEDNLQKMKEGKPTWD